MYVFQPLLCIWFNHLHDSFIQEFETSIEFTVMLFTCFAILARKSSFPCLFCLVNHQELEPHLRVGNIHCKIKLIIYRLLGDEQHKQWPQDYNLKWYNKLLIVLLFGIYRLQSSDKKIMLCSMILFSHQICINA